MNNENFLQETIEVLKNTYELSIPDTVSEEDLVNALEQKIAELMNRNTEAFLQLMYRLDISEQKLQHALHGLEIPSLAVARLVVERQMQKIKSRKMFGKESGSDEKLQW